MSQLNFTSASYIYGKGNVEKVAKVRKVTNLLKITVGKRHKREKKQKWDKQGKYESVKSWKAYALGKGMNEADSQRAWDPLEKKYISYDPDAASEVRWQQARCEQDAPLPEMSETEKRLLEINAAIAAIPLDPSWTTPPRGSQRRSATLARWRFYQQRYDYVWLDEEFCQRIWFEKGFWFRTHTVINTRSVCCTSEKNTIEKKQFPHQTPIARRVPLWINWQLADWRETVRSQCLG